MDHSRRRKYFLYGACVVAIIFLLIGYYLNAYIQNIWVKLLVGKIFLSMGYSLLGLITKELSSDWKQESKFRSQKKII